MRKPLTEEQKESARQRARAWYQEHKERAYNNTKKWRLANPDKVWRHDPVKKAAYDKIYYQNNRQKKYEQNKIWNSLNPEKRAAHKRHWVETHPIEMRLMVQKRRHMLISDGTKIDITKIHNWDSRVCGICSKAIDINSKYHIDHIIPVSRGGEHIVDNLQLTHPTCNLRKHNKLQTELMYN